MKRFLILLPFALLAGCVPHFKDVDSYNTMFRKTEPPGNGDPFTYGGIAEGSGGTIDRTSYATDNQTPDPRDATGTGKLGEIARDRTQTPGALPGETGTLPGANRGPNPTSRLYPGFEDLPVGTPNTSTSYKGLKEPGESKQSNPSNTPSPSQKPPTPNGAPPNPKSRA